MKKIALLLLAVITISSCSLEEGNEPRFYYEILPVESFEVPESVNLGQSYEIKLTYKRPTECHIYEGCYYRTELNTTTVGIQTYVLDNADCRVLEDQEPIEVSFPFKVEGIQNAVSPYIFKFYKGTDANGVDVFEEVIIPVNYN